MKDSTGGDEDTCLLKEKIRLKQFVGFVLDKSNPRQVNQEITNEEAKEKKNENEEQIIGEKNKIIITEEKKN